MVVPYHSAAAVAVALPIIGMWCITFIAGQLEQPFGDEANDLPLSTMQFDFNTSLLMLIEPQSTRAPHLKEESARNVWELKASLGDPQSTTSKENIVAKFELEDKLQEIDNSQ